MHKADNRIKVLSFRPQKHIMNQKPAETQPPSANRKTNRIPPSPGRHFRSRTPLRTKKKPRRKPGLRLSMQRLLLRNGCNADVRFSGGLLAEVHLAVHQGEEGVVLAHTHVLAGIVHRAPLTYDDIARFGELAAKELHAQPLAFRLTAVLRATYSFLVCHFFSVLSVKRLQCRR